MESGPIARSIGLTRDDWLQAVAEAEAQPLPASDAMTVQELADLLGLKRLAAKHRLERLVECGKAERTRKKIRRADGVVITVAAYRLVK